MKYFPIFFFFVYAYTVPCAGQQYSYTHQSHDSVMRHFDSLEAAVLAAPANQKSLLIDGIMREVRKSPFDTEKLHLKFGRVMVKVGKEIGDDTLVVRGLNILAISPHEVGGRDSALAFRLRALQIARERGFTEMYAKILNHLSSSFGDEYNDYTEAYRYALEGVGFAKKPELNILYRLGDIELTIGKPHEALSHYQQLLLLPRQSQNDSIAVLKAFSGIARYYLQMGRYDSAHYYVHQALAIGSTMNEQSFISQDGILQAQIGLRLGLPQHEVLSMLRDAITRSQMIIREGSFTLNILIQAASIYRQYRMLDSSLYYIHRAEAVLQKGQFPIPTLEATLYREYALIYAATKDSARAFVFQERYSVLQDSINQANARRSIDELEKRIKTDHEKETITKEKIDSTNQRNIAIILGITVVLLILGVDGVFYFRTRAIYNRNLYVQSERSNRAVLKATLDGIEQERLRIQRELHDGVGSKLSAVKIALSSYQNLFREQQPDKGTGFDKSMNSFTEVIAEIKRISYDLTPPMLEKQGLAVALEELVQSMPSSIPTEFLLNVEDIRGKRYDLKWELSVYRLAQEIVNNCIKHAQSESLVLNVIVEKRNSKGVKNEWLVLTGEDEGVGFSMDELHQHSHSTGLGLTGMQNRINALDGIIHINSVPGRGTRVIAEIPVS